MVKYINILIGQIRQSKSLAPDFMLKDFGLNSEMINNLLRTNADHVPDQFR